MRTLSLFVAATLSFALSAMAFGGTVITRDLEARLEGASPVELIPINIVMEDRIDRAKLESSLAGRRRAERRKIVVTELKAFAQKDQAEVLAYLRSREENGEVARIRSLWVNNLVCCKATRTVIRELAEFPGIRSIDWDEERHVLLAKGALPKGGSKVLAWGVEKIRAPEVWALGNTGQGVLVSVHDTGVDYNHTDLQDHMWDGGVTYPNHGWDFNGNDDDPMDGHGHGTHCAGTIAGDGTAGCSTGVAPDAIVMALKVLDNTGNGVESDVWESIQFAIDNGVDVMSFSIGWLHAWNPDRATWRTTFENAMTAGLLASVAAGNERQWGDPAPDNVRTPGDVPPPWLHPDQTLLGGLCDVVTCGATDVGDNYASFSSYGPVSWEGIAPWLDYPYQPEMGLIDPDVAAPGVNVTSCRAGGGYTDMSGTSMATPHVAGAMCLVLTAHPSWLPAGLDEALEMTAVDLGAVGKDNDYGAGRIDVFEAVSYGGATEPNIYLMHYLIDDPPPGNQNGILDPGETGDLIVTLRNIGLGATNVEAVLRESDPYVSVLDSISAFGGLAQGDSANNASDPYALSADPSTPEGHIAPCTLHITADGGYAVDRPISFMIGDPTTGPSGPDNYGYYCYDDRDVGYTECPTYSWFEIAPPGPGTIISEISSHDDETTTRTLPFTFKYYGLDETTISICSNGWMSFGLTSSTSYGNTPIPDLGGPPAMVAPFWDDLHTGVTYHGDVYEYYDTTGHTYILEWKEVAHWGASGVWETFQVILYEPLYDTTVTGDGEIICQYERVEQPNSCTVGIENHSETDGIEYLYNGLYDMYASPLEVGRAVKFTTDPPVPVGIEEEEAGIRHEASGISLFQSYPNPFTHSTTFTYSLPPRRGDRETRRAGEVSTYQLVNLSIYDLSGRLVKTLMDGEQEPGIYSVTWDGKDSSGREVAGGVYFLRLSAIRVGGRSATKAGSSASALTKSVVVLR